MEIGRDERWFAPYSVCDQFYLIVPNIYLCFTTYAASSGVECSMVFYLLRFFALFFMQVSSFQYVRLCVLHMRFFFCCLPAKFSCICMFFCGIVFFFCRPSSPLAFLLPFKNIDKKNMSMHMGANNLYAIICK